MILPYTPQQQQQQHHEEEEEHFYDSLDRTLSSNSSTSPSDTDDDVISNPPSHGRNPRFPISVQNYDVWTSNAAFSSSSVAQRRDRLFRALGLAVPDLPVNGFRVDFNRSVSANYLSGGQEFGVKRKMNRSRSECCTDCESAFCNSSLFLSIRSVSDTVNNNNDTYKYSDLNNCNGARFIVDNSLSGSVNQSNGRNSKCVDDVEMGLSSNLDCSVECNGVGVGVSDQMCTVKNLDNGKAFVVNEVQEDGMWNKLRDVGTGRQLTLEEFEMCLGQSPIVQELMRRQNGEEGYRDNSDSNPHENGENGSKLKKKVSWLKSIKSVASSVTGFRDRRSSDERDSSSEKGGQRSSSATDDSQDVSFHGPEKVRVRQYGKSVKELTGLYKSQAIQAHNGSIWTIKFSLDGMYLASAGEDCLIHVWKVVGTERKGDLLKDKPDDGSLNFLFMMTNGSPEPNAAIPTVENPLKRRGRTSISRKSMSLDHIVSPETVFGLSEKPICSFEGHLDDVLDLSWSKTQLLLSSSMDKTVRLWDLSSKTCLKIFSHSDYVTCIHFNPVDDRYFISGSVDAKVRIWSIPDRQVVDWSDLHEMVTAACYTPDGQGALVGSYKGSCRIYDTSENKLQQKGQINLQNKKKKSHLKKITGFQFAPGSSSEVLITSADSRIRVVDGVDLVLKFKGFCNTNSQISASLTANGKYVVCASEDSSVYIWKHEGESRPGRTKGVTVTSSYEHFHCQDVSVAIPWPGLTDSWSLPDPYTNKAHHHLDEVSTANHPPTPVNELTGPEGSPSTSSGWSSNSPFRITDRIAATWPEEKLLEAIKNRTPRMSFDLSNGVLRNGSAWGMVIVTAGVRGEIRTFQNFGLPVRT